MSNFGDLQNGLLSRCRQSGANWGGAPTNTATSLITPYRAAYEINQSYNRVLGLVKDFQIATLEVSFQTVANTNRFSLNPVPASSTAVATFALTGTPQLGTNYTFDTVPPIGSTVVILFSSASSAVPVITDSNGVVLTQRETQADPINNSSITWFDYVVTAPTNGNFASTLIATNFIMGYVLTSVGAGTFVKASGTSATLTMTESAVVVGGLQIGAVIAQTATTPTLAFNNGSELIDASQSTYAISHTTALATQSSTCVVAGSGALAGVYGYYPPADEVIYNPCAMQVYEYKYTQAAGQIRYIPFVSDARWRQYTAGYNQVLSSFSAFPDVLRQAFGQRLIEGFPGYGTSGDTITLTICPDPVATSALYTAAQIPCSRGNVMSALTDVPLVPPQYHEVILEGAVMTIARDLDKSQIFTDAKNVWDAFVQEMIDFGSSVAEGDAQQIVVDTWSASISPELSVM